jgi:4-aminobutyrate aminotransferase-like enzyme
VRGLGPMLALELPEQSGDETTRITREAREKGLMLLSCGIYGNVIRILVPFTIGDEELERGLDILQSCIG